MSNNLHVCVSVLVSLIIYFGLQVKIEPSSLASLWETELFNDQVMLMIVLYDYCILILSDYNITISTSYPV